MVQFDCSLASMTCAIYMKVYNYLCKSFELVLQYQYMNIYNYLLYKLLTCFAVSCNNTILVTFPMNKQFGPSKLCLVFY